MGLMDGDDDDEREGFWPGGFEGLKENGGILAGDGGREKLGIIPVVGELDRT